MATLTKPTTVRTTARKMCAEMEFGRRLALRLKPATMGILSQEMAAVLLAWTKLAAMAKWMLEKIAMMETQIILMPAQTIVPMQFVETASF